MSDSAEYGPISTEAASISTEPPPVSTEETMTHAEPLSKKALSAAHAHEAKALKKSQLECIKESISSMQDLLAQHVETLHKVKMEETLPPSEQTPTPPVPLQTMLSEPAPAQRALIEISDDDTPLPAPKKSRGTRHKRHLVEYTDSEDDEDFLEYHLFKRLVRRQSLASLLAHTLNTPSAPIQHEPLPPPAARMTEEPSALKPKPQPPRGVPPPPPAKPRGIQLSRMIA